MSVKEKEIQIKEDELETKSGHHTPEGLFTQPTKDIVDGLLKDANGDEELALKRITFYINRAGDGLSNKTAVNAAKKELEKKVEAKMEAKKAGLFDTLNEYFGEAYDTMFEDDSIDFFDKEAMAKAFNKDTDKQSDSGEEKSKEHKSLSRKPDDDKAKKVSKSKSIDVLLANGINPYWELALPHGVLYFAPYDNYMSLGGVYPDGQLEMWIWRNGIPMRDEEGNYIKAYITPQEFKDALEDPKNIKVVGEFERHWEDVDEIKKIIDSGDCLYKAWIERFFEENKDDYGLKNPYDRKTRKAFEEFWKTLSNQEKREYSLPKGVSDFYGLATKDQRRGMPIGKIRMKASPQRLNGKTTITHVNDPAPEKDFGSYNVPEDVFTKPMKDIVDGLLEYLDNDEQSALKCIKAYINRMNDEEMPNEIAVYAAKRKLEKMVNDKNDKDSIKKWLDFYKIDSKFVNEPITDSTGTKWKINKAIETHNELKPVQFELECIDNPEFKLRPSMNELANWIKKYSDKKDESLEEAYFGARKMAQPTIDDYNSLYAFLEQNGISGDFCRGAKLYGRLGQIWRITGYNLSDPENPMLSLQSYYRPESKDGIEKVASEKVPLEKVKKWVENNPKNRKPEIDWEEIMLDPFLRQKAKVNLPDPNREPMKIKSFDRVANRAKHGIL